MNEGRVGYERRGSVAYVTFERPERRNAMTWTMYEQLFECCEAIDADPEVRVAVFRGAGGKAFIAGTDIGQFQEFEGGDDGIAYEASVERIVARVEAVKRPTVAVVEGFAVGGGLTIACACDIRLCTPDAQFGVPIARTLGNCLSMANMSRLLSLVGPSHTKNLLLGAGFLRAAEAKAAGLVRDVVSPEEIDQALQELTDILAGNAPITMQVAKEAIRRLTLEQLPEGDDLVRAAYGSSDFREGVNAFVEKRKPQWSGETADIASLGSAAASLGPWIASVNGKEPVIADDAFITPSAVVVGEIEIGSGSSVWYGSVLRADDAPVRIGADCNVQDACVLHADPGYPLLIGDRVSLGHGAIVHGATLEDDVLIGMNAVVLNGARIGSGSVVAAGAVVTPGTNVPPRSLVAGVPGKVRREATEADREMIAGTTAAYKKKSGQHREVRFRARG